MQILKRPYDQAFDRVWRTRSHPAPAPVLDRVYLAAAWLIVVLVAVVAWREHVWSVEPSKWWDSVTYYAAGMRLTTGGELYALRSTDWVMVDPNPLRVPLPFMSPPFLGVAWALIAPLGPWTVHVWWAGSFAAMAAVVLPAARRMPQRTVLLLLVLLVPFAYQALSGNVNGYVIAGAAGAWLLWRSGHSTAAGALIAVLAAAKLVPLALLWWLVWQRDWRAVAAAVVVGLLTLVIALAVVRPDELGLYLSTRPEPGPFAPATILAALGMPALIVAAAAPFTLLFAGLVGVAVTRDHPDGSFMVAVATMALGNPVVYVHTWALLLAALAPVAWPLQDGGRGALPAEIPQPPR